MDGITFLRQIMQQHPTPTVICSSLTEKGAQITMEALEAGAVSIITKPTLGVGSFLRDHGAELVGEVVQYGDTYRLAYVRGPEGIIVALAEQLG